MGDYIKNCPSFAAVATEEEFKAIAIKPEPTKPVEPVKPSLTKKQALDLVEYFAHIGDNPCPPKYCGINVDTAADKVGIPRAYAHELYAEFQAGVAAVADPPKEIVGDGNLVDDGDAGKLVGDLGGEKVEVK